MAQFGLALHTASSDLGLALSNFEAEARSQVWPLGRELSTHLHLYLEKFLTPQTWTDLAFLAVAKGPGGFTSTRLGVVTARTLAQQLQIPLFAASTLEILAWEAVATLPEPMDIAVQMQAQRGEWFTAIYGVVPKSSHAFELVPHLDDRALPAADWQQTLETWPRPYHLIQAGQTLGSSVVSLLEMAHRGWQRGDRPVWTEVLPFYGQHPVVGC